MTENGNFPFEVVPGPAPSYEPRIRWRKGEAYAAVELGRDGATIPLPGKPMLIDDNIVLKQQDTLILSERSGGSRDFLDWWCQRLNRREETWVLVHAREWAQDFFDWSPKFKSNKKISKKNDDNPDERSIVAEAIERFGTVEGSTERAQSIAKWTKTLQKPFTLIIRDLMGLGPDKSLEIATALRSLRDHNLAKKLKIVLVSHSESILGDLYDRSGYLYLLRQFRVPSRSDKEIIKLVGWLRQVSEANASLQPHLSLSQEAVDALLDSTGGQPLLIQRMIKSLSHLVKRVDSTEFCVNEMDVANASRLLRSTPPDQCRIWVEDLKNLLSVEPDLISTMRSYVTGHSLGRARFPPSANERPLFVAGWVGLDRLGRWGIKSSFHAHLARPVLDKF